MWNSMSDGYYDYNEPINEEISIYFNKKGDIKVYYYGNDTTDLNIYRYSIEKPEDFLRIAPIPLIDEETEDYFKNEFQYIINWIRKENK